MCSICHDREKQSDKVHILQCKNKEGDRAIADAIFRQQNDKWSLEVKGRLEFVNDLRAENAICHEDCDSLFNLTKENLKYILRIHLRNVEDE